MNHFSRFHSHTHSHAFDQFYALDREGLFIFEHLPKQAAMLDRFILIRSMDAKSSNHEPNMVFQTDDLDYKSAPTMGEPISINEPID
jgi:hypothetical protein